MAAKVRKYVKGMEMAARMEMRTFARKRNMTATVIIIASLRASTMFSMLVSIMVFWVSAISNFTSGYFAFMEGSALSTAFMVVVTCPFSGRSMLIPMAALPLPL